MSYESIPEGTYTAVAVPVEGEYVRWDAKTSPPKAYATFQLIDPPFAGRQITWFANFSSEKAEKFSMDALRNMGWVGDDIMNTGPLNQKVSLVIERHEHEGKVRDRIKYINRFGGGAAIKVNKPMSLAEKAAFAMSLKSKAAGLPVIEGERVTAGNGIDPRNDDWQDREKARATPKERVPGEDDDLPW